MSRSKRNVTRSKKKCLPKGNRHATDVVWCVYNCTYTCVYTYTHIYIIIYTCIYIVNTCSLIWRNLWSGSMIKSRMCNGTPQAPLKFSRFKHHEPRTNCMRSQEKWKSDRLWPHHIQPYSCIVSLFSGAVLAKVVSSLAIIACATQSNCLQAIPLFASLADNLLPHPSKTKYIYKI